jgi:hypothetical protein
MKGIAITLATRADGEAVAGIEKLIGHKIPRQGGVAKEPVREDRSKAENPSVSPHQTESEARSARPAKAPEAKAVPKRAPVKRTEKKPAPAAASPVVEDIKDEWNGPVPSFLNVGA